MLFEGNARDYPHLRAYLSETEKRRHGARQYPPFLRTPFLPFAVGGLALLLGLAVAVPVASQVFLGCALALAGGYAGFAIWFAARNAKPIGRDLQAETVETARTMHECLERRRLHRDIGEASMRLLEEASFQWVSLSRTLNGAGWSRSDLPEHFQRLREQALGAADAGMAEILELFRPALPSRVQSRPVSDFVEEAIEGFVFRGKRPPDFLPPTYAPARELIDRMRTLADQMETVTGEVEHSLTPEEAVSADAAIERCLATLDEIQRAEQELRQGLDR